MKQQQSKKFVTGLASINEDGLLESPITITIAQMQILTPIEVILESNRNSLEGYDVIEISDEALAAYPESHGNPCVLVAIVFVITLSAFFVMYNIFEVK